MHDDPNKKEITEALESIREIKKTLKSNIQFLRPYMYDRRFIVFCIVMATLCLMYTIALHLALTHWGSFGGLPVGGKIGFIITAVVFFGIGALYKSRIFVTSLRENQSPFPIEKLLSVPELRTLVIDSSITFGFAFLLGFLAVRLCNNYLLFFTFSYVALGYLFYHYAVIFYLNFYRAGGVFSYVLAVCTLLPIDIPPVLLAGGSYTLFILFMAFIIWYCGKRS